MYVRNRIQSLSSLNRKRWAKKGPFVHDPMEVFKLYTFYSYAKRPNKNELARRLERNRSRNGGLAVHGNNSKHGKASILDFNGAAAFLGFFGLVFGESKGVVQSRNHVLRV